MKIDIPTAHAIVTADRCNGGEWIAVAGLTYRTVSGQKDWPVFTPLKELEVGAQKTPELALHAFHYCRTKLGLPADPLDYRLLRVVAIPVTRSGDRRDTRKKVIGYYCLGQGSSEVAFGEHGKEVFALLEGMDRVRVEGVTATDGAGERARADLAEHLIRVGINTDGELSAAIPEQAAAPHAEWTLERRPAVSQTMIEILKGLIDPVPNGVQKLTHYAAMEAARSGDCRMLDAIVRSIQSGQVAQIAPGNEGPPKVVGIPVKADLFRAKAL